MTRSQRLIASTMRDEIDDGISANAALIRTANKLGITPKQTLRAWVAAKERA